MFSCKNCQKQFSSKNTLEKHTNKKFKCTLPSKKALTLTTDSFRHYNYKFTCKYCGMYFEKQFFLDRHVNSKNTCCFHHRNNITIS